MNIFKKIALVNKITKTVKEIKNIMNENSKLSQDLKVAITNLKVDIQIFSKLLPSCSSVVNQILALIKF